MFKQTLVSAAMAVAVLSGCSSNPERMSEIDRLQQRYEQLSHSSDTEKYAPVQLNEAEQSMQTLNRLMEKHADDVEINHQFYLASRKVDTLEATVTLNKSEEIIATGEVDRKDILLDARTREAEQAKARARELEEAVANLTAKETERGLVLSLDNILFEFDKATMKPGAERTIGKISEFLNEYPDRKIVVEGFTDNVGGDDYNLQLSEQRAQSVKEALIKNDVSPNRVQAKGYGEAYPVASNDSSPGRLQNRRVEIVIAEQGESVSQRVR